MSIPDSISVPMTPYRQPTGPLVTLQTSFGTPGPCTTPYYYHFGTPTILSESAESGFKSSRKRPSGKENSLKKKKKKKNTIADLSTYDKLQYFYGFLREELRSSQMDIRWTPLSHITRLLWEGRHLIRSNRLTWETPSQSRTNGCHNAALFQWYRPRRFSSGVNCRKLA